jgi:hypothetical protein
VVGENGDDSVQHDENGFDALAQEALLGKYALGKLDGRHAVSRSAMRAATVADLDLISELACSKFRIAIDALQ